MPSNRKIITIQIVKSSRDGYWYKNKIGEIYDACYWKMDTNRYQLVDKINPLVRTVDKRDVRVLDRFDKIKKIKNKIDETKH